MQAQAEIVETEKLLRLATFSGVKAVLSAHLESCKASLPPPPAAAAVAVPAAATEAATAKVASANTVGPMFEVVSDFAWDQGKESISVYVDLAGVGDVKEGVTCDFARDSFDLKVMGLGGKNYRLLQDNLDKDVVVDKCKCLVKANKVRPSCIVMSRTTDISTSYRKQLPTRVFFSTPHSSVFTTGISTSYWRQLPTLHATPSSNPRTPPSSS